MKNRSLILTILTVLCLVANVAGLRAQMPIKLDIGTQAPPDSADLAYYGRKRFWQAAGTVVGFNVGLWAFDRYVQNGDFARISFNSIKENFKHGFIWDNDKLGTNMFLHPYNGNLYYNAARSNGYNFWQSSLFAIGGSAMWELFMECEYPSTNDIIATPIGGSAIGEMTYRVSDTMIDDRTGGAERAAREVGVFLVNPIREFTRIINGDAWRRRATSGRQFGTPDVGIELTGGCKLMEFRHNNMDGVRVGGTLGFTMEYGDRFEVHSTKPYDYFTVHAQLNFITRQPVLSRLNVQGRLLARELLDHHKDDLSIGLYQDFDYYDSDTISKAQGKCPYKLGVPASVGVGAMYRNKITPHITFDADLHVNGILLGGILSDYYDLDERNYNLAMGFSVKGGMQVVWDKERFCVSATHALYRLYTMKGYPVGTDLEDADRRTLNVMGDKSAATFGITEVKAQMRLHKQLYLGIQLCHFFRGTQYRDFPDVNSSAFTQSLQLVYKL